MEIGVGGNTMYSKSTHSFSNLHTNYVEIVIFRIPWVVPPIIE